MSPQRDKTWLLLVIVVYAAISALLRVFGLRAVSDDDFARVVIAQDFSHLPKIDPTGTSWLPVPFWFYGSFMMLFGPTLFVAKTLANILSGISGALFYTASRWAGLQPKYSAVSSLIPIFISTITVLLPATIPEIPTTALVALALSSLITPTTFRLGVGAVALFLATLSRYDHWSMAPIWGIFCVALFLSKKHQWAKSESPPAKSRLLLVVFAFTAQLGPSCWVLWNHFQHGNAFTFVRRVVAYRTGLGVDSAVLLFSYPIALIRYGWPLLVALLLLLVLSSSTKEYIKAAANQLGRPLVCLSAMLVMLSLAEYRGGAPTHHPERVVLIGWVIFSWVLIYLLQRFHSDFTGTSKSKLGISAIVLLLSSSLALELPSTIKALGADRAMAISQGYELSKLITPNQRALLVASSYDHFALAAALARPNALTVVVPEGVDPRSHLADPFESPDSLWSTAKTLGVDVIVARGEKQLSALKKLDRPTVVCGEECLLMTVDWSNSNHLETTIPLSGASRLISFLLICHE